MLRPVAGRRLSGRLPHEVEKTPRARLLFGLTNGEIWSTPFFGRVLPSCTASENRAEGASAKASLPTDRGSLFVVWLVGLDLPVLGLGVLAVWLAIILPGTSAIGTPTQSAASGHFWSAYSSLRSFLFSVALSLSMRLATRVLASS